jgi:hypothetical protein
MLVEARVEDFTTELIKDISSIELPGRSGIPADFGSDTDRLQSARGSCHENLAQAKRKSEGLGSSSGRSRCPPVLQRFPSEDAKRVAGNKIALNAECIVDGRLERTGSVALTRAI